MKKNIGYGILFFVLLLGILFKDFFYSIWIQKDFNLEKKIVLESDYQNLKREYEELLQANNLNVAFLEEGITSKVILHDPCIFFEEITILKGSEEGINEQDVVVNEQGLVGIVSKDTTTTTKVAVPLTALFCDTESRKPCVWVFGQDSTVSKRPVVLDGTDGEGHAVVIEGLMGKERIVRAGVHVLRDGERVRVIEKASNTNVGGLM